MKTPLSRISNGTVNHCCKQGPVKYKTDLPPPSKKKRGGGNCRHNIQTWARQWVLDVCRLLVPRRRSTPGVFFILFANKVQKVHRGQKTKQECNSLVAFKQVPELFIVWHEKAVDLCFKTVWFYWQIRQPVRRPPRITVRNGGRPQLLLAVWFALQTL